MQIGSFGTLTNPVTPQASAMHGSPILVDTIPSTLSVMLAPDLLTDDSAGNAYLLYNSPLSVPVGVVLAKITPGGVITKVQLVGSIGTAPLLLITNTNPHGGQVARIHNDVIYVFMLVRMSDGSDTYLASKCADLTNIGSASCWTKLDGLPGVDLLPFTNDAQFGMDIDGSGKVYISASQGGANVRVQTFTPGVGWSGWQLVGNYPGICFSPSTNCIRATDIEVDDDTGIVHVLAGNSDSFSDTGIIPITIYAKGASPGAIPSGLVVVTKNPLEFFGGRAGGIATFPSDKVLILGSSGTNKWNFFNGAVWLFGTSGTSAPFGSAGDIDNLVIGALSKAPDGKGRAFTTLLEGGVNKYQYRTFDPDTQSWSAPNLIYTTPPPVHFSIRSVFVTSLDPNPNSCNQWYAWFDPHQGKLFADFEGPGSCNTPPIAIAQDVTVSADENCQASASVDNGSFDPDKDPITLSQSPPGPYSLGATPVTLTVEDSKGASDKDTAIVTVIDDSPPMITAPLDITVIANTAGGYSGSIGKATASDNCDSSPTIGSNAPNVFPLGDTTVTWTATDDSGNSALADQVVTVKPLPVLIDIKRECIDKSSNGVIPVAIFGSATFDVNNIDPGSVMLEGLAVKVTGKSDKLLAHIEDDNGDGFNDLVVQIQVVDGAFPLGTTMATLTGNLFNGIPLEGVDSICIT